MRKIRQTVQVTLELPKGMYERITQAALAEQQQVDDLWRTLIEEGLKSYASVRELLEHVSDDYRARLEREGKLHQSSEDVLQEMRDTREQIARELYPRWDSRFKYLRVYFALRRELEYPASEILLFDPLPALQVYIPFQIFLELQRYLNARSTASCTRTQAGQICNLELYPSTD